MIKKIKKRIIKNWNTKQAKEERKLVKYAVLTSMLTVGFLFIIYWTITVVGHEEVAAVVNTYEHATIKYEEDIVVKMSVNLCGDEQNETATVLCVNKIFAAMYNYQDNETYEKREYIVQSPTTTFKIGGVCRDAAVYYCAVLKQLNIACKAISMDNHVINLADTKEGYCILDQQSVICR